MGGRCLLARHLKNVVFDFGGLPLRPWRVTAVNLGNLSDALLPLCHSERGPVGDLAPLRRCPSSCCRRRGRGGRERVGRCEHRTPRPPSHARSGPALSPHRSRRSPCPHCTDPLMPQRRTRPARPLVGLTSSSAAPSAATVEVAAAAAADELVGPKRRRATTLTRLLPTSQASTQHERGRGRHRRRVARRRRRCHCRRRRRRGNRRSPRHRPRRLPSRRHRRPCRRGLSCPRWSTPRLGTAATAATVQFQRSPVATAVTTAAAATPAAIFAAIADAAERGGV